MVLGIGEGYSRPFGDLSGTFFLLPAQKISLAENTFLQAGKGAENRKGKFQQCFTSVLKFRTKERDKFWRIIRTRNLVLLERSRKCRMKRLRPGDGGGGPEEEAGRFLVTVSKATGKKGSISIAHN